MGNTVLDQPPEVSTRAPLTSQEYHDAAISMMEAALRSGRTHEENLVDADLVLQRLGFYDHFHGLVDEAVECDTDEEEEWRDLMMEEEETDT